MVEKTRYEAIEGDWDVEFCPKLLPSFEMTLEKFVDFSTSDDERIKYFSGTAVYRNKFTVSKKQLAGKKRFLLDLGRVNDIVEVRINGEHSVAP